MSPFSFLRGSARPSWQARLDLLEVQHFCSNINQWGPAGMALAARLKLEAGASNEELLVLIRSSILTSRMFRPTTRFNFESELGSAHGAYCLIAWVLFGVLRHRHARLRIGNVTAPWDGTLPEM